MPSFLTPLLRDSSGPYCLVNERTGRVVARHLLSAFDSTSRRTGLLSRNALPSDTAMIIAPTNAIHTFFMKFAIDVLFVSKDGHVRKIAEAVRPWRIAACFRAFCVIELGAFVAAQSETRVGDRLVLRAGE